MKIKEVNRRKGIKEFMRQGAKSIPSGILDRITYNKRFFSVKEVAEYLHMSEKTIYNKLSLKTFPIKAKRRGRKSVLFEVADVVRYADSLH